MTSSDANGAEHGYSFTDHPFQMATIGDTHAEAMKVVSAGHKRVKRYNSTEPTATSTRASQPQPLPTDRPSTLTYKAARLQRTAGILRQYCARAEYRATTLKSKADQLARLPNVSSLTLELMEKTLDDIQSEHTGLMQDLEILAASANWFQNMVNLGSMPEVDLAAPTAAISAVHEALGAYRRSVEVMAESFQTARQKVSEYRRRRHLEYEQLALQRQANESCWERLLRFLLGELLVWTSWFPEAAAE
ncbi:hypothetical protein G647_03651 [Cladophialophora carrionii CBS 160.54]|uniref:Uncharacterized protein n=1 Tax=Cladophialophora carrionii CBS 160.54 TaxID=1279043 RepID=V9DEA7_9EURO|nr:uncharacterized protein G647_03651 [Cladophialophora carrionii CBS 160.54]ETI24282.1 hypothetical protein G647_03651 [Cladophialophora carrionii CBS 160.54]